MTYLLIDMPIKIANEAEPDTLCLTATIRPDIWVASSRFLLVVSLRKTDIPQKGDVWDVSLGWHFKPGETWSEEYHTPYVLPENIGKSHTKITFRSQIHNVDNPEAYKGQRFDGQPLMLLSQVMKSAPRSDNPGGFRGSEGSIKALQYPREGIKRGSLWLTREAAAILDRKVGNPARKGAKQEYLSRLILQDK